MPKSMIELATITDQEYTNVGSRCKARTKRRKAGLQIETCPVVVPQAYIGRVVKVQKQEGEQPRQGTVTAIEREAAGTRGFRYRVKYDGSGGDGDGDGDGNGDGDAEEEVLSFAAMSKALVS